MKREEVAKIISVIRSSYPQQYSGIDDISLDLLIEEWHLQFKNVPYSKVYVALQRYISVNVFPPTIAGIKNVMYEGTVIQFPSKEEAWKIVLKSGRCLISDAINEYRQLPTYLKEIVTVETLCEIGNASNESLLYIKNGFLKDFESIKESHKREYLISSIIKKKKKRPPKLHC